MLMTHPSKIPVSLHKHFQSCVSPDGRFHKEEVSQKGKTEKQGRQSRNLQRFRLFFSLFISFYFLFRTMNLNNYRQFQSTRVLNNYIVNKCTYTLTYSIKNWY